mmetsp:Transcript_115875/g.322627  ORF Transcript_115875/g.322627 Transcript_115875/m.322627 type:complete len:313 (+) Transcript_115875:239-1177(+)|eukprot:CAMPEP_0179172930 /NCGR_PEP_ID=MMETSP0796-20121207/85316_1 /TAXON_ID=73915 /ORGANISM="Pyrodinium bahamense, Strain pbaha01" /LENGTH=312 /DNA_ID=CAMNT_0020876121 /DNA_START=158 /DNA_END=1096 /DNA_ORIENTATION=+
MGNSFLFAAPEPSYHPLEYQGELLWVPREGEDLCFGRGLPLERGVPCLLLQRQGAARLLVFFHANSEDLGQAYLTLRYLRTLLGLHVLAVEYAGYGICSGAPSEDRVLADAEAVMGFVLDQLRVPSECVVLMGRSLGSGPAIYLASRYPCGGLVTLAAFVSIRAIVGSLAGLTDLFVDAFDNGARIRSAGCRTLIIHGREDTLVSLEQAQQLTEECGADVPTRGPVLLHICDGVGHNNYDIKRDIIRPVQRAFPDLQHGRKVQLADAERFLSTQPGELAQDVLARAPWSPGWVPDKPPYGGLKILGFDGEEI